MKKLVRVIASFLCVWVGFMSILWFYPVTSANTNVGLGTTPAQSQGNVKRDRIFDDSGVGNRFGVGRQVDAANSLHHPYTPKVFYRNKVVVVTFHDISPHPYSEFVITPQVFSADLDAFQRNFHVIRNQQFIDFLNGRNSIPPNAVLLTFDDGYQNMYTYATPILIKHHMQGTFFDIVSKADASHRNEFLTWDEMASMTAQGMCIESHTYHLHREIHTPSGSPVAVFNTRLRINGVYETPGQYYQRVFSDFTRARVELALHTGMPVNEFAWPYGHGTLMAVYIAHKAGYKYLFTTRTGSVSAMSNPLQIHRIDVGIVSETPGQAVKDVIAVANRPPEISRVLDYVTDNLLSSINR